MLLQAKAIKFCQIDTCRVGGINELLAILLLAKKFNVAVCPHAGGVGLCEYVRHICVFDYISIAGTLEDRICESTTHLHEHFYDPVRVEVMRMDKSPVRA
jgi:L-fuconate dehydratase